MFIKLKNEEHIEAIKIVSISPEKDNYLIEMQAGPKISLLASEYPWLVKICGFLIELRSGTAINTLEIVSIALRNGVPIVYLSTGTIFEITPDQVALLMGGEEMQNGEVKNGVCESVNLENRINFLQSKNVICEDFRRL